LFDTPWLYDLDVTTLGRSDTYEFKFKRKKIVLKPAKLKSNVRNNKGTITDKNNKTSCYPVTRSKSSLKALVISLLTHLEIPSVFSLFA